MVFLEVECNKIRDAHLIPSKSTKITVTNVFRRKETINKVPRSIFTGYTVRRKVRLNL